MAAFVIGFCLVVTAARTSDVLLPEPMRERRWSPPQRQPWWWGIA